jgi:hypothetical protein
MARKSSKDDSQSPEAMRLAVKRAIAEMRQKLALAAEALDASYIEDRWDLEFMERDWSHRQRDLERTVNDLVIKSHGWPGAGRIYPHEIPEDVKERLASTLPQYPDRHFNDHRSEVFCLAFHRRLPALHTDEWAAWKESGEETIAVCAGYRITLEQRIAEAHKDAAEIESRFNCTVDIGRFGDLTIPRDVDPWPEIQMGAMDDRRYVVLERATYGHHPDDRPLTLPSDENESAGSYMRDGRSKSCESEWCLRTVYIQEYRPPTSGERIPLGQVPYDHWYRKREGAPALKRDEGKGRDENEVVIYIGDQPDLQIGLFGDTSDEAAPAFATRSRRPASVSIPGLLAEA